MITIKRPLTYLIAVIFLFSCIGGTPLVAASLNQLKKNLEQSSRHMDNIRGELRKIKGRQKEAKADLYSANRTYASRRSALLDIRSQLRNTKANMEDTLANIAITEKRLRERNELLTDRLLDTYKHGNFSYIEVLLNATDFSDMLDRGYIFQKLIQSDVDLVNAIKADKQELEDQKEMLNFQLVQRVNLEARHTQMTKEAYNSKQDSADVLDLVNNQRVYYETMLAMEMKNSKEIESIITRESRTTSGRKRHNTTWNGSFIRPVQGEVTSYFGMRLHPITKTWRNHTGIDIGASSGTSIKAADGGEVIYAGWLGAYGNAIIIDHGGGMQTVYGHCSKLLVSKGSNVDKGDVIGRVGSTGWSTGPHLHFEIRKNGVPIDPLQ